MIPPLFSIIFVNYQSVHLLRRALLSLRSPLQNIPHEILVINNDLQERALVDALKSEFSVQVEHLLGNFGFARANNIGAKRAIGEILFFLNPDTVWQRGSFLSVEACLKTHEKAILGARLLGDDGKDEQWSCGSLPTLTSLFWRKIEPLFGKYLWEQKKFVQVGWVSGASLAVKKKTFESLGGFDETFFLYYEDVDLSFRAFQKGAITFRFPFLVFKHGRGQSHASKKEMKRAYFKGQLLYFEKHRPSIEYKILAFLQRGLRNIRS